MNSIATCEHCKINKGIEEDMTLISSKRLKEEYEFADVLLPYADKLLCDDCYTEYRRTIQHMFGLKDLFAVDDLLCNIKGEWK